MNYGFVRVAAAVPHLRVADCAYNTDRTLALMAAAEKDGVQCSVFPELGITSYTCGDLFLQQTLLESAQEELCRLLKATKEYRQLAFVGLPIVRDNQLFNCAVAVQSGRILGVIPKIYIPGYKEFYEERWFATGANATSGSIELCGEEVPFGTDLLFQAGNERNVCVGAEICEDLWVPIPPSSHQALGGATILVNLSASNDIIAKSEYRRGLVSQQAAKCVAAYVYASSGIDESSTDLVFGGHAMINDLGAMLAESKRFSLEEQLVVSEVDVERLMTERFSITSFMQERDTARFRKIPFTLRTPELKTLRRKYIPHPFVPDDPAVRDKRCSEIFAIQTSGLGKRYRHTGLKHAVIGISGGLDSTLALLVTARAFDSISIPRENIIAVTMPGFGTTDATYTNALNLMKAMGVTIREIPIADSIMQHFNDIGHDPKVHDVTYENAQARERTQILMDFANSYAGLVIGTGDLSELALGFATYNGDHMSMYGVNASIPKTLVKYLVKWVADNVVAEETRNVLHAILETPISPELLPPDEAGGIRQKTEEIIGPYELHDFFLYHMVRYGASPGKILFLVEQAFEGKYRREEYMKWLTLFYRRFFAQQFKRSCLPDGPKVGTISLSPRGDWRMPSDASARMWLRELETLEA